MIGVNWIKRGKIFSRESGVFFKSHAMRVVPYIRANGVLRLFITSRCSADMMHPTFIDVDPTNPSLVLASGESPLLELGSPGLFDDSGITLGSIVRGDRGVCYAYYTGWKRRRYGGVGFELSIGLARLGADGDELHKLSSGPLLAQDRNHPYLVAGPYVVRDGDEWRMWYCSGGAWVPGPSGLEPIYSVYTASSSDGLVWVPTRSAEVGPLIPYEFEGEVISAPWVVKHREGYSMYYCHRGSNSYSAKNYRIGLAVSEDRTSWVRKDSDSGISCSETGWDSEMICYPALFQFGNQTYLFYSGNGVGRGGIGYAVADCDLHLQSW